MYLYSNEFLSSNFVGTFNTEMWNLWIAKFRQLVTHFTPLVLFNISWKHQKTSGFQRLQKEISGMIWLNSFQSSVALHIQMSCKKSISNFKGQYPTFLSINVIKNIMYFNNYQCFPLMTLLGEIIELYKQWGNFLENLIPTLIKETENKASMLKINVSCYFHS